MYECIGIKAYFENIMLNISGNLPTPIPSLFQNLLKMSMHKATCKSTLTCIPRMPVILLQFSNYYT